MKQDTYGFFDIRKFGAAGNGVTDDTAAIQKAIDQAAKVSGVVVVPPGRYISGELQLAPHVEIRGAANFSFRHASGSVLILRNDTTSRCLLNMTYAYGAKVHSLCLKGRGCEPGPDGLRVHGIMVDKKDYGSQEDTPTIDNCRVEYFSGDGIRLERIWCFSVRHSHMLHNGGDGLSVRGWDGFVIDNWLSGNSGAGYGAYNENSSVTMTGNRIEWNCAGGIVIHGGSHYNITGNYIDRSGNAGIDLQQCAQLAVTGNVIYRSGKPEWTPRSEDSLHQRMIKCSGLTFTGNTLTSGTDDGGKGKASPETAMHISACNSSVIMLNVMSGAAIKTLIRDDGEHINCEIGSNPGTLR